MTDPRKIEKLMFILTIGVCWAYKTGELQARKVPISIKKHGRKARSIFRIGLNILRRILFRDQKDIESHLSLLPYLGLTVQTHIPHPFSYSHRFFQIEAPERLRHAFERNSCLG